MALLTTVKGSLWKLYRILYSLRTKNLRFNTIQGFLEFLDGDEPQKFW